MDKEQQIEREIDITKNLLYKIVDEIYSGKRFTIDEEIHLFKEQQNLTKRIGFLYGNLSICQCAKISSSSS